MTRSKRFPMFGIACPISLMLMLGACATPTAPKATEVAEASSSTCVMQVGSNICHRGPQTNSNVTSANPEDLRVQLQGHAPRAGTGGGH